jgi:DNA polymerase II small subunit/DNA polymerase delta subunit B
MKTTEELKENFTSQLEELNAKIKDLEDQLSTAREYKLKLVGGLETLALMIDDGEELESQDAKVEVVN